MFSINCLEITATKSEWEKANSKKIYKNLLSDKDFQDLDVSTPVNKRFLFNDFYKEENGVLAPNPNRFLPDNFFGENINIQAIVGKNGSGKSTLMDLMYMAINNFCYMFERGRERLAAAPLYYINNLHVNLYYSIDNSEYHLDCKGECIALNGAYDNITRDFFISRNESVAIKDDIIEIVKPFFYTIVSNYSLHSYISSNYGHDITAFNKTSMKDDIPNNVDIHGTDIDKSKLEPNFQPKIWIDSIFHKNDGYVDSIVLNPFRNHGNIDMEEEEDLSKFRFIAFLINDREKRNEYTYEPFVKNYSLDEINYSLDDDFLQKKFQCGKQQDLLRFIDERLYQENDTVLVKLYKKFRSNAGSLQSAEKIALFYAEQKIKKIIDRYDSYTEFSFKDLNLESFLSLIKEKPSHITVKLQQALHFLEYTSKNPNSSWTDNVFSLTNFKEKTNHSFDSIDNILKNLPPPFFKYDIKLKKNKAEDIDYKHLSSGELQLIQTLYTHAYHIQNILSVTDNNRAKYRNINLIFDELEICLHPEYQRKFVSELLHILTFFRKTNPAVTFNAFLITHSPFVLSDIPSCNILYLEEGSPNTERNRNSFAQNIGDMMYDSFFMEKTIGEFAEEKLKELIRKKQGKKTSMSDQEVNAILKSIGDPVIRSLIEEIEANDD